MLPTVHQLLAADRGAVTVAVRSEDDRRPGTIVAAWPGYVDVAYGVAIDVGSTTVAGHLCDLSTGDVVATAGRMNPQIRFGEDLMSRVSYVMMNEGGAAELTVTIRGAIDELVGELLASVGARVTASWRSCSSATRSCTTSCSASIRRRWARLRSCSRRPSPSRVAPVSSNSA